MEQAIRIISALIVILLFSCEKEIPIRPDVPHNLELVTYKLVGSNDWYKITYSKDGVDTVLAPAIKNKNFEISFFQNKSFTKHLRGDAIAQGLHDWYLVLKINNVVVDSVYDHNITHKLEIVY